MMNSRGRVQSQLDWDPMQDDFDDSTYNQQYNEEGSSGGVNLDHCRLYITNIPLALNEVGLRAAFCKYGTLTEVHISQNPQKRYGLITYETPGEAKHAMSKLNRTEPLKLNISIAHKKKPQDRPKVPRERPAANRERQSTSRDETSSNNSRRNLRKTEEHTNGDNNLDDLRIDENIGLDDTLDPDVNLELELLRLEQLKVKEEQLLCKHRILVKQAEKKAYAQSSSTRCIMPDGRIVVRTVERTAERDGESSFGAGAGDSNVRDPVFQSKAKIKCSWDPPSSEEGSSTPSTCVLCSENSLQIVRRLDKAERERNRPTDASKKDYSIKFTDSKTTNVTSRKSVASKISSLTEATNRRSDVTSKKLEIANKRFLFRNKSEVTCDLKYSDFYSENDDEADETNRLIQLRNSDYLDIVEDALKLVLALAGYPKSKMRLRQMELFQRCLNELIDMQLKAGLLKKVPSFLDYYLNRGAIVCVCKDFNTRDWMVRVCPGLQERMATNLILFKAKIKRLCLAVFKIPQSCWPATAQDAFKLLQYFNPTLKTENWKIYAQKSVDDVECTSFLIDRVSGEIIRGPTFKNVIDYNHMEFELTGYAEIYYESLLSDLDEDVGSVASRVKLLEEIRSADATPRNISEVSLKEPDTVIVQEKTPSPLIEADENDRVESELETVLAKTEHDTVSVKCDVCYKSETIDVKKELLSMSPEKDVLKKLKDVGYVSERNEVIIWSDDTNQFSNREEKKNTCEIANITSTSVMAVSDKTESIIESNDNLVSVRDSNVNIDSNRGIAYHRRTNYLHVENELKIAITLDGYPQNKLEGTHIRRLKHLFKEYVHKDMKMQRFTNLIIPKFQDIYLSNGAVIYICDSLETKEYLTEVLPKFINSTGLKLTFRDIKNLVRYTRVVMRLPKEQSHIESMVILMKLQDKYPGLKPECWKYYSDVAGKQKRQFGVDPLSLKIIKSPDFEPTYEGESLSFRIIDRQKRDISIEEQNQFDGATTNGDGETKKIREIVQRNMYAPIDQEVLNAPLTKIRTEHYSDLIADDLKLYVGPSNYPESRIDEIQFRIIKMALEVIICEAVEAEEMAIGNIPKYHDMYLFDGVIFIICQDMLARNWIENILPKVDAKLQTNLKATEFRGAVGIVSMCLKTDKNTEEVIDILQKQNPRLRTKFWRKISTVRTNTKLDVVLQIDKLSALVITGANFNKYIGDSVVHFKLGHLQLLLKPKNSLEELRKAAAIRLAKRMSEIMTNMGRNKSNNDQQVKADGDKTQSISVEIQGANKDNEYDKNTCESSLENKISDLHPIVIEPESPISVDNESIIPVENKNQEAYCKMILKIPSQVLPEDKEDLNIIFDLLEDKNPGLNTELWEVSTESTYPNNGRFNLLVDKQSASIIQNSSFDSSIGGEKLKFYF